MEKRWRCKVCGYVHKGENPPEICPVCGVGAEKFELMEEEAENKPNLSPSQSLIQEMLASFKPHAVMAHFPNALMPTLAFFLALYLLLGVTSLDSGIYVLLGLVAVTSLITLLTGVLSWKRNFQSAKTRIFQRKLVLGGCLVLICFEMLLLRYNNPDLLSSFSGSSWFFFMLAGAALYCVTMLGHYGGILVFGSGDREVRE